MVSRICGGRTRWRALRSDGVSPVRVSTRIGRPISSIGVEQVALDVDRQRLQRRDVERVQALGRLLDQVADGRQEAGQRLARAGRGDQQRAAPGPRQRRASRAGGGAAASRAPRTSCSTTGGSAARSEVVGPLAPALLLLVIELVGRLLGLRSRRSPGSAGGASASPPRSAATSRMIGPMIVISASSSFVHAIMLLFARNRPAFRTL